MGLNHAAGIYMFNGLVLRSPDSLLSRWPSVQLLRPKTLLTSRSQTTQPEQNQFGQAPVKWVCTQLYCQYNKCENDGHPIHPFGWVARKPGWVLSHCCWLGWVWTTATPPKKDRSQQNPTEIVVNPTQMEVNQTVLHLFGLPSRGCRQG